MMAKFFMCFVILAVFRLSKYLKKTFILKFLTYLLHGALY